jgi:hemoglobin/transferrin/lactoferrin receptor protein
MRRSFRVSPLLLTLGILSASPVSAQQVAAIQPETLEHLRKQEQNILAQAQPLRPQVAVEDSDTLEEVSVTANRRPQLIVQTSESVTVITRSDIESLLPLAQTLPDLLRIVPGVQAGGTSPFEPSFSIRGLGDGRSAIFIDGERQNINQGDDRSDLFSLNPQDIERIEILRGPASGTYGADVTGGLINVITRLPKAGDPLRFGYQTVIGGYSTFNQTIRTSFGGEGYAFNLGVGYRSTGDARDGQGAFVPNQQDSQTYSSQLRLFPNADNRITLKYSGSRLHTGILAVANFAEGERFSAPLLSKDRFGVEWRSQKIFGTTTDLKLNVYYNQLFQNYIQKLINEEGETTFDQRITSRTNTLGTNLQFNTPLGAAILTYGMDFFYESGTNASLIQGSGVGEPTTLPIVPDGSQTGQAGYILLDYPVSDTLRLNGGIRYDAIATTANSSAVTTGFNLNNSALTPKAGLVWTLNPDLRVRANYSQGFRVPSFRERFFQGFAGPLNADLDDVVIASGLSAFEASFAYLQGNPRLSPLRASSFDLGIGGGSKTTSWDIVYFNNNVTGLLSLAETGEVIGVAPVLGFTNIDARFQGIEVQGSIQFTPEWRLRASFTWTDAIAQNTNTQIASVAPTFGALQLAYRSLGGFSALLQARASSERAGIPGYGTVDLNFGLPISPGMQLTLTVSNITNSYFAESLAGKNVAGSQLLIGIRGGDF